MARRWEAIAQRFAQLDASGLAYACRNLLAFVQVPPRGVWGEAAQVRSTTAESWLGRPLHADPSIDAVVVRYLGAFGPATVADISSWSRLTGMRAVVERLGPRLRTFRDERGRELFDLPDAPRPDPDTPAPVRFLPEFDNVLLSHADRSRFISEEMRGRLGSAERPVHGCVLLDGRVRATWRIERLRSPALHVDNPDRLAKRAQATIGAEGRRLLRFLYRDDPPAEVRFLHH